MANVLEKIVIDTRQRIQSLKTAKPLSTFIDSLVPSTRCLYQAMSKDNAGFILECKKASPSKGLIREDFDIEMISNTYFSYAAGISVLTDEKYFQGSFDYLSHVAKKSSIPVLNKDFFVDEYQVYLARYYGADAILLMLSVLNDDEYRALAKVADSLSLSILTEVSNEQECKRAIDLDAKLIGINNRNLRDLSTDINRTFELVQLIPNDRLVISESGIYTNAQVRKLAPVVDGFLVGSSLMAEDNLDLACRKLIFGENKCCGIDSLDTAKSLVECGAYFGGLIFVESSPRYLTLDAANNIVNQVNDLNYVGVFVDDTIENIIEIAESLNLYAVQLHGNESQTYIDTLRSKLPPHCAIWKAISITDQIPELEWSGVDYVLDGKSPGSGKPFDWRLIEKTAQNLSQTLLAGGINLNNIEQAIHSMNSHGMRGLDINSGVESSKGKKDPVMLAQAFKRIRQY